MNITNKKEGFTLIEILIVVAIIGGLMVAFGGRITKMWGRIKTQQASAQLASIKDNIMAYNLNTKKYPKTLEDLESYMDDFETETKDPWGEQIVYNNPPVRFAREKGFKRYELYSLGPDGEESPDDIVIGE